MFLEDPGPEGDVQGKSGIATPLFAVAVDGDWTLRPGKLTIKDGMLDSVEIEGAPLSYPRGPFGATVVVYLASNLRRDSGRVLGDVLRQSWESGLLVRTELVVTGVEFTEPPGPWLRTVH
jgi:hypothetical protein